MKNAMPEPIYLKDYKVPDFLIEKVDLIFELNEEYTRVTSHLTIHSNSASQSASNNLILQGECLELVTVSLNGNECQAEKTD